MKRWWLACLLTLGVVPASAQVGAPPYDGNPAHDGTPSVTTGTLPLTYTGGDTRMAVGVDKDGNTQGEFVQIFQNTGEHAIVGQLWWGHAGAGGLQADYNWLFGTTLEQARQDPDSATVAKLSFAIDQNEEKQRQANVALAIERKEFFLNFFLSGKAGGTRNSGTTTAAHAETVTSTDDTGTYTQTRTDVATTLLLSQPYSYTVGVHGGHFSDALTARFNGGFDYARGNQGANRKSVSVSIDKYIGTHGWSVSGVAEHSQNTPVFGDPTSDNRWWLFLRYEFGGGGAFRPYGDSASASIAWINRALHEPVTGHSRNVETYVTRGKTTTTSTFTPKQYTARFPIVRDDTAITDAGAAGIDIDVLANDTDPDNGTLRLTGVGTPAHGTAVIAGTRIHYTPAAGYTGTDEFTYTVTGSKGLTATGRVRVTVTPGPTPPGGGNPPVARDDTTTTPFNTAVTVAVLGNDVDPSGYPLTVTAATPPAHGSVHVNGDGTITYTPNATFSGTDRFGYTIENSHGGTASASVTVVVQPPPPPVAVDDTATTAFGTPVEVNVLANDSSAAGFALTVVSVTQPANGTAKILNGGVVRYTPGIEFSGSDQFTYAISDGYGGTASAKVTITVLPATAGLVAGADKATTAYATAVTIDVLANDYPPPGKTLSIKSVTTPQYGTAVIVSGGIRYTPASTFYGGTDTFTYTVGDGTEATTANVTVTVLPPQPIAQNDSAATPSGKAVTINVLANDSDPSGSALSVTKVTAPAHGTAQINPDNTVTYTPPAGYSGSDQFSYTIANTHGGTATASVSVSVAAPLLPVAVNDSVSTPYATAVKVAVLSNDSDPNGLPLTVVSVTPPVGQLATVVINNDNTITYTPNVEQSSGPDSFTYTISDGYGQATATVTVTVQAALAPVAKNDSFTLAFNSPATTLDVLANDTDPQNLTLFITGFTQPANGTVAVVGNTLTYTPGQQLALAPFQGLVPFVGTDTFTYSMSNGATLPVTATVTVNASPPLLVAAADSATCCGTQGPAGYVDVPVLQNDSDSGQPLIITNVSQPSSGTASGQSTFLNNDGTIRYVSPDLSVYPATPDSFTYTVVDPYGQQKKATVTINFQ